MELVIGGIGAVSIINTVSKDIVMKTIQRSLSGTYKTIMWFSRYDQPYAQEIVSQIKKADLQFNVTLIDKLLQDLSTKKYNLESKAVLYALESVSTQLDVVHAELRDLQTAIEKHKNKYFNNWRCVSSNSSISTLINNSIILNNRYQELLKLLNIVDAKIL
ncbi:hypothetical protein Hokovirus_4_18 [Hokovirus HKV1]|uniref:Uncharacterized protein n=1 Tax=Hokovirus HKV1 TaxID=1977638 RepID=A0A1V0SHD2_9VIRU|nr:hypothetical protein Hokovirus_4_18 [Hokovirus HKV1]